ncbi:MAG: hypothetical protein KJ550_14040 [Proteobacteria bacterium]|nr:hypothetical protein [Desulfobacteraceae bacterium]MBU3981572.1 hypothetical protein [Pseudomonadota bacterium]MBU4014566.1 hypothetical protein [Pseudomonadota bacterium]MBU4068852.1 hypothetical protein [Pseudomonadota bacterium]MBU4099964.1 hypothetical protein [Pseudomonadota bacterium]
MKKILWFLSVVLVLGIATGASADTRSEKCNTYSNDLGISSALDNYSGDICVWADSIADKQGNIDCHARIGQHNRAITAGGDSLVCSSDQGNRWRGEKFRGPGPRGG